ncbi:MAG: glycosyl transferase family protein [Elstera sp.]
MSVHDTHSFAPYVRTLGRGPGRSRSLTREEARDALGQILAGEALPEQVGAFLMLLRYRGEDPDEMAGLVEAARTELPAWDVGGVDLDWPSYADGRTRGAAYFLHAAKRIATSGKRVLLHGLPGGPGREAIAAGLADTGIPITETEAATRAALDAGGIAFVPTPVIAPGLARLLSLRGVLGLRSPINTVARLLNPFDAAAGVDGVFHPPYIHVHLEASKRLNRTRLAVLKGGGGEAERRPEKPITVHLLRGQAVEELLFPALCGAEADEATQGRATVQATLALALLALGDADTVASAEAAAQIFIV